MKSNNTWGLDDLDGVRLGSIGMSAAVSHTNVLDHFRFLFSLPVLNLKPMDSTKTQSSERQSFPFPFKIDILLPNLLNQILLFPTLVNTSFLPAPSGC
jgi:hypothetical protein